MSDEVQRLPCPFCDGTNLEQLGSWYLDCDNRECIVNAEYGSPEKLIEAWNTRPREAKLEEENARLSDVIANTVGGMTVAGVMELKQENARLREEVEHLKGVTESYRREDEERGRIHRLSLKDAADES